MRCWLSLLALLLATFAFGYEPKPGAALPDSILSVFNRSHADSESNAIQHRDNVFVNLISRTGDTPNNYLYCGAQYDADLGLYYNRARYLNTDLGRFWTRDLWEGFRKDPLSLHKYLYAHANPVSFLDSSGQVTLGEIMHVATIWGGLGLKVFGTAKALQKGFLAVYFASQFVKCIWNTQVTIDQKSFPIVDIIKSPCWPLADEALKNGVEAIFWTIVRGLLLRHGYDPFTWQPLGG